MPASSVAGSLAKAARALVGSEAKVQPVEEEEIAVALGRISAQADGSAASVDWVSASNKSASVVAFLVHSNGLSAVASAAFFADSTAG